jgi:Rrf2 family transcriptional regulator, cysteine metabolism repressor
MKISYKGDYSLKAMLDLSEHHGIELVTSRDMARRIDAPVKFLEQVLLQLKKGGFIESRRGKEGGYMLSKFPGEISVGDVVRYIDGPIEPIACLNYKYADCTDIKRCVFKKMWEKVHKATTEIIDNVTFEDLAVEAGSGSRVLSYSI